MRIHTPSLKPMFYPLVPYFHALAGGFCEFSLGSEWEFTCKLVTRYIFAAKVPVWFDTNVTSVGYNISSSSLACIYIYIYINQ